MDIIKTWLTYKLGLEIPKPKEFEKRLANGVLIAEILRKYGILSDDEFISLRNNNSEKTRFDNIQHLEEWLTGSGVKIKQSDLEDIAMEKVGVGMKLLYELYMWFEYGPRIPKLPGEPSKGFEFGKDPSTDMSEIYEKVGTDICGVTKNTDEQEPCPTGHAYTPYDRIEFPRNIVLQKPFLSSSEANQAQHLYFYSRTVDVLKKQKKDRVEFALEREHRLQEFQVKVKDSLELFPDYSTLEQFDLISIRKQQEAKALQAREAKLRSVLDDMDKFDSAALLIEQKCESDIPVYADGRGDQCEYENRIRRMKCKRLEETRDEEERSLIRKHILDRTTRNTPLKMRRSLEEDLMNGLTKLPAAERLLVAFISRCQQEQGTFIQHSIYEAGQLQKARSQDLEKELRIRRQEEEFREYAASEMANPLKSYDFVCRVLEEPDLIQKLANGDATIKDMIERSLQLSPPPPPPPSSPISEPPIPRLPPACTPSFTRDRSCKEFMVQEDTGRFLMCRDPDEVGPYRGSGVCILKISEEDAAEQESNEIEQ